MVKKRIKKKKGVYIEIDDEESSYTEPGITIHTNPPPPKLQPIDDDSGERRGAPRYLINLETILYCQGQSFKTRTVNISKIGMLLAEAVPVSFVKQDLEIVIIDNHGKSKNYFLLRGRSLGAPFRSPRIEFTKIPSAHKKKFYEMLKSAEKKQKQSS